MRPAAVRVCGAVFALLCLLTLSFLLLFTRQGAEPLYLSWSSIQRESGDGALTQLDSSEESLFSGLGMEDGALYWFAAELAPLPEGSYLRLYYAGAEFSVLIDEEEVFSAASGASPGGLSTGDEQVQVPLPPEGGRLRLGFRVLDPSRCLYPPLASVSSLQIEQSGTMAYANLSGIPAGAFALVFLLVCGLFLLGAAQRRPDYRLLLLVLASALLAVYRLVQSCGWYFLPQQAVEILSWHGFSLLLPLLLLVYLAVNAKAGALRVFGRLSVYTAAMLAAAFLVSLLRGSYLSRYLCTEFSLLFSEGIYDGLLYWLTVYLTFACAAVSLWLAWRSLSQLQAEARTLRVKNQLTLENYQDILRKNDETAAMRHEWKNQLAALHLLLKKRDLEAMEHKLDELDGGLARLTPKDYTGNAALNAILQSAAAKAEDLAVAFQVSALVPPELQLREEDLCALLLNLLDNALEAAKQVTPPEKRFVRCRLHLVQGFLAVKCENSYSGCLKTDEKGRLQTTKEDPSEHGFGLRQMRAVAEKYHSTLDISYDGETFTVQTALKI